MDVIATSIVLEQGKTFAGESLLHFRKVHAERTGKDAQGDVLRGLQVVETACAATTTLLGSKLEGIRLTLHVPTRIDHQPVSRGMDTENRKLPLGVCARSVLAGLRISVELSTDRNM